MQLTTCTLPVTDGIRKFHLRITDYLPKLRGHGSIKWKVTMVIQTQCEGIGMGLWVCTCHDGGQSPLRPTIHHPSCDSRKELNLLATKFWSMVFPESIDKISSNENCKNKCNRFGTANWDCIKGCIAKTYTNQQDRNLKSISHRRSESEMSIAKFSDYSLTSLSDIVR